MDQSGKLPQLPRATEEDQRQAHVAQRPFARADRQLAVPVLKQRSGKARKVVLVVALVAAVICLLLLGLARAGWPPRVLMSLFFGTTAGTGPFDGRYELVVEESFKSLHDEIAAAEGERKELLERILQREIEQFSAFWIRDGVITSGKVLVQEFRLASATITDGTLVGRAIWHEDVHDPGDCCVVGVRLELDGDTLRFSLFDPGEEPDPPVVLRRIEP
jgi:hypothetical protein